MPRLRLLMLCWVTGLAACSTQVAPFPDLPWITDPGAETGGDPGGDPAVTDPGPDPAPDPGTQDPGADAADSGPGPDTSDASIPPDGAADPGGPDDLLPDASQDLPGDTGGCEPVVCGLYCPFGFLTDEQGCEVCACRDCAEDQHCEGRLPDCPKSYCSPGGKCLCDCSAYEAPRYFCPGNTAVPFCSCSERGVSCKEHPEWQCPTLCEPGNKDYLPCPDGSSMPWCTCVQDLACQPQCTEIATGTYGWQNPCTQEVLRKDPPCVPGSVPTCGAIGTRSEGWLDSSGLITYARCGPQRDCLAWDSNFCVGTKCTVETNPRSYRCPNGAEVPFCSCSVPEADCEPICNAANPLAQHWDNPCTGKPLVDQQCQGCRPYCDRIGTRSEGWYSSCGNALIAFAMCGTGTWACSPETPWTACGQP